MAETPEPTEPRTLPDAPTLTPLIRRSNLQPERPALPPDIEEQFQQLALSVQTLSAHFLGEAAVPEADNLRERGVRRIKKFQRAGAPGDEPTTESAAEGTEAAPETTDSLALNKQIAWPRQDATGAGIAPQPAMSPWWEREPDMRVWAGALALGLLLLGAGIGIGYLAFPGRGGTHPKVSGRRDADLFAQPELTEQAFLTANEAMHAEHAGNADQARKIYEAALGKHLPLSGMDYRLALLAVGRNDRIAAEQRLEHSALGGENVAECCYILARLAGDEGNLEEEADQFAKAIRAQPLEGKYFFYYAEALRRQGKPQAAITAFEQALDRPFVAANGDLYLFKERLAKIELSSDEVFNADLVAHLKQDAMEGDWLLLAAAQDLDHQSFAEAAQHLRQAENRLPSSTYANLTRDYLFQAHAKQPEVTSLLNRTVPTEVSAAGPTVLDPASWSPERADPANWPPAGHPTGH